MFQFVVTWVVVVLACVPLYDAMRRTAPRFVSPFAARALAALPLVLLVADVPLQAWHVSVYLESGKWRDLSPINVVYFDERYAAEAVARTLGYRAGDGLQAWDLPAVLETFKWCGLAFIAAWLSAQQVVGVGSRRVSNRVQ